MADFAPGLRGEIEMIENKGVAAIAQDSVQTARNPPAKRGEIAVPGGFSAAFSAAPAESSARVPAAPPAGIPMLGSRPMLRPRILIVEDEPDIAEVLRYNLE